MKVTICDPPSGCQYGFPRAIPQEVLDSMIVAREKGESHTTIFNNWLISCDYPSSLIESYGDKFYCRYWEEDARPVTNITKFVAEPDVECLGFDEND